jgi:hypothetical protein
MKDAIDFRVDERHAIDPVGFRPLRPAPSRIIGLALTLIQLISIPTPSNPARSTGSERSIAVNFA